MRRYYFALTVMAVLVWIVLPATAEDTPRQAVHVCRTTALPAFKRADFSKAPAASPQFEECWYQSPSQAALEVPASVEIAPGSDVDPRLAWRNRIRAMSGTGFLVSRAFPVGRWGYRFHRSPGFRGV